MRGPMPYNEPSSLRHSEPVLCLPIHLRPRQPLEQLEIIQLIPVLHDIPLNLASHRPGDKVLHTPRHQERRIRHSLGTNSHVSLLNHLGRRLHRLRHAQPGHQHGEPSSRKGADRHAVLDCGELGGCGEDAHVVELIEEELLVLSAGCVVGWEKRKTMGELTERL